MSAGDVVLTEEGYEALRAEVDRLCGEGRRAVAARLRQALIEGGGDLAENPEYLDAKEEQALLERRIGALEHQLRAAEIVYGSDVRTDLASVGSKVRLRDLGAGEIEDFVLVGSAEVDPARGRISNESPVGRALLGRRPGEQVQVETPGGLRTVEVVAISANRAGAGTRRSRAASGSTARRRSA